MRSYEIADSDAFLWVAGWGDYSVYVGLDGAESLNPVSVISCTFTYLADNWCYLIYLIMADPAKMTTTVKHLEDFCCQVCQDDLVLPVGFCRVLTGKCIAILSMVLLMVRFMDLSITSTHPHTTSQLLLPASQHTRLKLANQLLHHKKLFLRQLLLISSLSCWIPPKSPRRALMV